MLSGKHSETKGKPIGILNIFAVMKALPFLFVLALPFCVSAQENLPEPRLKNIRQLTFGGDNAEAYFSFDNKMLTMQVSNQAAGMHCDQIYMLDLMNADAKPKLISTGKGRTTCSYFMPGNKEILFASTHHRSEACPPPPEKRADGKYLWQIHPEYDIFVSDLNGNIVRQLTNEPGYDAEATISPKGDKIVFTSDRSGDLELYIMDIDGSNVRQVTNELGYDGGAFFSPDGERLVFRTSRPKTEAEIKEYKELLAQGLVAPTNMEIYTCKLDGSDMVQVTNLGKANWAPFYTPDGKKIIFSSNHASERGYSFQLYLINADGTGPVEQVTRNSIFNAFPMFSPDGKKLVFSSNRNNNGTRDTNVFIADWNP